MENKTIFSNRLLTGSRSYFFDIQQTVQGKLYMVITESKKTNEIFGPQRILVFEEDMKDFVDTLRTTLTKYKELREARQTNNTHPLQ